MPTEKTRSLKDQAVGRIEKYIIQHRLKAGDRLPPERKMATDFNISRTVIRDAVNTLNGLGILQVKHRSGIFVADVNGETVARQLSSLLTLNRHLAKNLFQVREVLETSTAGWAAENCDESDIAELDLLAEETNQILLAENNLMLFGELDRKFHLCVARISKNTIVLDLMQSLLTYLAAFSRHTHSIPGRILESARQHKATINAIREHDVQGAKRAMELHLASVYNDLENAWDIDSF